MSAVPPTTAQRIQTGNGPGTTPLSIGAVTFTTAECPRELPIGGLEQMMVVHHVVGGGVVQQSFGPRPEPVAWHGKLYGPNIALRVAELRLYASAGVEIPLSWGAEQYYCVVRRFIPTYQGGRAFYEIVVEVTRDANGAFTVSAASSVDQQIAALQAQADAANVNVLAGDSVINKDTSNGVTKDKAGTTVIDPKRPGAFQQALATLRTAITAAAPLAQASTLATRGLTGATQTALALVTSYLAVLDPTSKQYADAKHLASSIQLIGQNVALVQSTQSVTVMGGDLFAIAARVYGDATLAYALAAANGLTSPMLPSGTPTQIKTPPALRAS